MLQNYIKNATRNTFYVIFIEISSPLQNTVTLMQKSLHC